MDNEHLKKEIKNLCETQRFAVLATIDHDQPLTSLVAFATTEDLQQIFFATDKNTKKYTNIQANEHVSLLIDNRENYPSDINNAVTVTAIGRATLLQKKDNKSLSLFLAKHPNLQGFIADPNTVVLRVHIKEYHYVRQFQHKTVLIIPQSCNAQRRQTNDY